MSWQESGIGDDETLGRENEIAFLRQWSEMTNDEFGIKLGRQRFCTADSDRKPVWLEGGAKR
ncbi:MAG: hypothetical protein ACK40X_09065 [Armatimonadota bacterium]